MKTQIRSGRPKTTAQRRARHTQLYGKSSPLPKRGIGRRAK